MARWWWWWWWWYWCWWWLWVWRVSLRNWRRRPPVTFYSLTLADYRQLMHNKYTPLRVHYHLINISLWKGRGGGGLMCDRCIPEIKSDRLHPSAVNTEGASAWTSFLFLFTLVFIHHPPPPPPPPPLPPPSSHKNMHSALRFGCRRASCDSRLRSAPADPGRNRAGNGEAPTANPSDMNFWGQGKQIIDPLGPATVNMYWLPCSCSPVQLLVIFWGRFIYSRAPRPSEDHLRATVMIFKRPERID